MNSRLIFAFRRIQLFSMLTAVVVVLASAPVMAQRLGWSSVARMNQALRQQEINQLQTQLDEAKKLLDSVSSQGALTEAQLDTARKAAVAAREALKEAEKASRAASSKIRKIEEEILESQSPESDYAKALDGVDLARRALDAEMHRVLGRQSPATDEDESTRLAELARLSAAQRVTLNKSDSYVAKKDALNDAMKELARVKTNLLHSNEEWKNAHDERRKIEQEVAKNEKASRGAALDSSEARGDLKSAAQIAASARATIAQIEARLHALGAKEKPATDKKPENGKRTQ